MMGSCDDGMMCSELIIPLSHYLIIPSSNLSWSACRWIGTFCFSYPCQHTDTEQNDHADTDPHVRQSEHMRAERHAQNDNDKADDINAKIGHSVLALEYWLRGRLQTTRRFLHS